MYGGTSADMSITGPQWTSLNYIDLYYSVVVI